MTMRPACLVWIRVEAVPRSMARSELNKLDQNWLEKMLATEDSRRTS